MKVFIPFYSLYGHVYTLAQSVAQGVKDAGAEPVIKPVAETLPAALLEKLHAAPQQERGAHLPSATVDDLVDAGAIIFGSPTRFGCMCAQMRAYLDGTGALWGKGSLVGKIGSAFTSTATQHGGQETTLLSFHTYMLHHGMLIAGVPFTHPGLNVFSEISGGSPYGAGTITGGDGSRAISENELGIARRQGQHVAELALKLNK